MTLHDINDDRNLSLQDLRDEWMEFRSAEPWNHSVDFQTELFEILMATVNGRNDCDVIGLTPGELSRVILRLRRHLNPNEKKGA